MTIYLHRNETKCSAFYWIEYSTGGYRKMTKDESIEHERKMVFTPEKQFPK